MIFTVVLRMGPPNTVYDYVGKAELSKGYWNPQRKLGVATHLLAILKQQ